MIDLRNDGNKKKVTENKNLDNVIDIVEKILDFNKQQEVKGLKMLTPRQMLQVLPISLAQVKAGNMHLKTY